MVKISSSNIPYLLILIFGLIYLCSLTFTYVEGDDASTIVYHALGRDASIQTPYSPYHSMMDMVLNILPANEVILRYTAIAASAIAAMLFFILLVKLLSSITGGEQTSKLSLFSIALPFIIPELFFFGLIYNPTVLAMAIILLSHLIIRKVVKNKKYGPLGYIVSFLLFGLGSAFRWDVAIYGVVIFTDLIMIIWNQKEVKRLKPWLIIGSWGILSVIAVFVFIYISGYSPKEIGEVLSWAKNYMGGKAPNYLKRIGVSLSLFTPAFIICIIVGFINLIIQRRFGLLLLGCIGFLPKLYVGLTLSPKGLIMALPGMILIAYFGFEFIYKWTSPYIQLKKYRLPYAHVALYLILMVPWIIGVQMRTFNTSWGPGFEIRRYDQQPRTGSGEKAGGISFDRINIRLAAGLAIPTSEGPRPVWGYAYTLLGGAWREFVSKIDLERKSVLTISKNEGLPILQNNGHKFLMVHLLEDDFLTNDADEKLRESSFYQRTFLNRLEKIEVPVFYLRKDRIFDEIELKHFLEKTGERKFVCFFSYSSELTRLKNTYPNHVQILGPQSALFDFTRNY
ncbi:hypothetical protein QQ008_28645 [Fulvivirgaceae bacterium BMA10]|uniref:Glycosyltransferase RgtA/B/C/D-like domain-containing protein n=1 Tax=Splendidivirga corallicola TaxID=3051826 RepID=A0ABT8KZ47_9BACT|nr:hypothetical protein [Fulvivirgaceae bacterium BMA10]